MSILSPIFDLSTKNYYDSIEFLNSYFCSQIQDKSVRPNLFSKSIYINCNNWVQNKSEMFWHLISLGPKESFNVLPCSNDPAYTSCNENCLSHTHTMCLNSYKQTRTICLYRGERILWINEIIQLANNNSEYVKKWKNDGKLYIRFQEKEIDYVLIFVILKNSYQLISAFPVFYLNVKQNFDVDYLQYHLSMMK